MPVLAKKAENPDEEEPDSCFKVLDTEFRKLYPLVRRRRDAFELRQGQNQKWSDMSARLKEFAVEAELQDLSYDELIAYLHVMATTDPQLKQKFFEMETLTLDKMAAKAASYESAESGMKGLDTAKAHNVSKAKFVKGNTGPCPRCHLDVTLRTTQSASVLIHLTLSATTATRKGT